MEAYLPLCLDGRLAILHGPSEMARGWSINGPTGAQERSLAALSWMMGPFPLPEADADQSRLQKPKNSSRLEPEQDATSLRCILSGISMRDALLPISAHGVYFGAADLSHYLMALAANSPSLSDAYFAFGMARTSGLKKLMNLVFSLYFLPWPGDMPLVNSQGPPICIL